LHKMTPEAFESVIAVHLLGSFYVSQPAFVHMREAGYGRLVMTTSAAGLYGNFGQVNYSAAKLGLVGMAKSIAHEGAKYGVKANVIAPVALSRMTEGLISAEMAQAFLPEAIAPVVAYLVHEKCALSGEVLSAYGGHVGRVFVGETKGITMAGLSVEDVAANIEHVTDTTHFEVPTDANAALLVGR
jgi:NAD(P)-dependent dehydrogenase (short-subunit alcohol dehydrogenase family)